MVEAKFYKKLEKLYVQCQLCPHNCIIQEGDYGECKSRLNKEGTLYSTIYGKIVAINLDPIEKKPLYHFYPSSKILSVGTTGCNFHCKFCQNHEIAQVYLEELSKGYITELSPERLVQFALQTKNNIGIAFTYNEPSIWYEYVLDASKLAKEKGLKTVMVSNGFINEKPLERLNEYIDAYSVDLKSYDNYLYENLTHGKIEPVKKNIEYLIKSGKHMEIDYLVIPGYNDDLEKFRELMKEYKVKFGKEIPLHINRYFPCYKMRVEATAKESLFNLEKIAKEYLDYVHVGNI